MCESLVGIDISPMKLDFRFLGSRDPLSKIRIQNMRFQNIILENTYVGIETQNTHGKISNFSNKKIKYLFRGWEYDRMGFYIIQTNSNQN